MHLSIIFFENSTTYITTRRFYNGEYHNVLSADLDGGLLRARRLLPPYKVCARSNYAHFRRQVPSPFSRNCGRKLQKLRKSAQNVWAPLRVDSTEILITFHKSSLGPRTRICTYTIFPHVAAIDGAVSQRQDEPQVFVNIAAVWGRIASPIMDRFGRRFRRLTPLAVHSTLHILVTISCPYALSPVAGVGGGRCWVF